MLLCALRDSMSKEDSKSADLINQYIWQVGDWTRGTDNIARLELRDQDNRLFRNRVLEPGAISKKSGSPKAKTDTQKKILRIARRLYDAVMDLDMSERRELVTYLATRCFLVVVATSNRSAANRVFGVLNTRGLDLSPTDILKATIAESASADRVRQWEKLEDDLGRVGFRSLFTHIYTISAKTRNRKPLEDVFIPEVLGADYDSDCFIDDVLEPYSETFDNLVSRGFDGMPQVTPYLRSLRMVDNQDWVPTALRMVKRHGESDDRLVPFLRDLERLAYSMFVARTWRDPRVDRYVRVLEEIDNDADMSEDGSAIQLTVGEKAEMIQILREDINPKWVKPVLLKLNQLQSDGVVELDHKVISVEHVLPQNPHQDSQWERWFPSAEVRERWTWKLANLVLLSRRKNSQAGNLEFGEKKRTYFSREGSTSFELTQRVKEYGEWTPEVLQRRQDELINMLADEWRLR